MFVFHSSNWANESRKMFEFRVLCTRKKQLVGFAVVTLAALIYLKFVPPDSRSPELKKIPSVNYTYHNAVVCMVYHGRLGNRMFMYAFQYVFAIKKDLKMVKKGYFGLQDIFMLQGDDVMTDSSFNPANCSYLPYREDKYNCGYDEELYALPKGKDVYFYGYFQSWRYLRQYEDNIRRLFTFKKDIRTKIQSKIRIILHGTDWNYRTDQLVGVHIRRGDHLSKEVMRFGKKIPSANYITKAMKHMNELHRHIKVRFIICSDDMTWSKEHLKGFPEVYFSDGNNPVEDFALLSMTNHTIITVGTFGWWAAFLSNGTTIYFKDLFVQNSDFAKEFRDNSVDDFFPPSWIGFE